MNLGVDEMAEYTVTKVRKELSEDGTHKHIEGVCINEGTHYTRKQVVDSINLGNSSCPKCSATPYIKTNPDSTKKDNLDNLDAC